MSELYGTDRPGVDEMRLREIQAQYDAVVKYMDEGGMHWPPSIDADLGLEGEYAVFDALVMDMVPEMLQELGRRLREDEA